jgi:hypothetical protein
MRVRATFSRKSISLRAHRERRSSHFSLAALSAACRN